LRGAAIKTTRARRESSQPPTTVTFPPKLSIPFSFSTQPLDSSQLIPPTHCPIPSTACPSIIISNRGRSNNDGGKRTLSSSVLPILAYNNKPSASPSPTCLRPRSIFKNSVPVSGPIRLYYPDVRQYRECIDCAFRITSCRWLLTSIPISSFFYLKKTSSSCLELHSSSCYTSATLTRKEWSVSYSGTWVRLHPSLLYFPLILLSTRSFRRALGPMVTVPYAVGGKAHRLTHQFPTPRGRSLLPPCSVRPHHRMQHWWGYRVIACNGPCCTSANEVVLTLSLSLHNTATTLAASASTPM
jgi:hypothetical protein